MEKYDRHLKILELIQNSDIQTQEELVEALSLHGFEATQATVSRDIRELRIIKVLSPNGGYKYATAATDTVTDMESRLNTIFSESAVSIDHAKNLVVIKTLPGMAQAAASVIDSMQHVDLVGSIAGDDTLLLILRDDKAAQRITARLKRMIRG